MVDLMWMVLWVLATVAAGMMLFGAAVGTVPWELQWEFMVPVAGVSLPFVALMWDAVGDRG